MAPKRDKGALRRLGERVKALREQAGMSQESVAFDAGIHVNHLSTIERGVANPSFLVLLAISRVLRVRVSELVDD